MRVLHMSSSKAFGEPERHMLCLVREMSRRGHEMFVALRPTCEWHDAVAFLPPERVLKVSIRNSFGMFSARSIARFIDRRGIDIVHAHQAKDYLAGSIIRRAARNVSLVLTRHVARPLKPFHRYALRNIDAAIGLSANTTDVLRLTFAGEKIYSASPTVHFPEMTAARRDEKRRSFRALHQIPYDVPLVAAIGELSPVGGQRDLALAAGEVLKKVPDACFVIAGDDRTPNLRNRRELRRLVKVLGLENRVVWLNEPDDASDVLAAADLFVSPTHLDVLPRLAIEALATAVPVVATTSAGVLPSRNVVDPREPVALAKKVVAVLRDMDKSSVQAADLQEVVRRHFSVEKAAEEVEAVYRRVLGR